MINEQIISELSIAASEERKITKRVVELIAESLKRKLWAPRGFANAHVWLVQEFHYSESAAARRLDAARILVAAPEVGEKLSRGDLTLSSLAKAQTVFRQEEKRTGQKISKQKKSEVLQKLDRMSGTQTERVLAEEFPDCHAHSPEKLKAKRDQTYSLSLNFTHEQMEVLKRTRELMSHSHPEANWAEIITHLAEKFNAMNDPVARERRRAQKSARRQMKKNEGKTAAVKTPVNSILRDQALAKANGCCEFKDPVTGNTCGSQTRVQVDHIMPKALGGTDKIENLRCLCATHNRMMAEEILGPKWANAWKEKQVRRAVTSPCDSE